MLHSSFHHHAPTLDMNSRFVKQSFQLTHFKLACVFPLFYFNRQPGSCFNWFWILIFNHGSPSSINLSLHGFFLPLRQTLYAVHFVQWNLARPSEGLLFKTHHSLSIVNIGFAANYTAKEPASEEAFHYSLSSIFKSIHPQSDNRCWTFFSSELNIILMKR